MLEVESPDAASVELQDDITVSGGAMMRVIGGSCCGCWLKRRLFGCRRLLGLKMALTVTMAGGYCKFGQTRRELR